MELLNSFVQLDPDLQNLIALGVTALVSFLLLQLANLYPALAAYLGQYKVAIVTWLTGLVVNLIQNVLNGLPATWDNILLVVMRLIVEIAIVLLGFTAYRRLKLKGSAALLPNSVEASSKRP